VAVGRNKALPGASEIQVGFANINISPHGLHLLSNRPVSLTRDTPFSFRVFFYLFIHCQSTFHEGLQKMEHFLNFISSLSWRFHGLTSGHKRQNCFVNSEI
jgi:hypothetical protein